LKSITFAFASTDYSEVVGIDSVRITGDPQSQWIKTYSGTAYDYANSIQQTSDGGYIVAGYTNSTWGKDNAWVLKLDGNGNVQWQKTYGGTGGDVAYSIQQTSDGGYIMAGTTPFGAGSGDAWVLKLDGNGNVLWQKTYGGGEGSDGASSIQQTFDGGYIVAGTTDSFGAGTSDICLLRLDSDGNVQWQKTYGGAERDYANSIQQTSDDGYIVAGHTYSFGAGYGDAWVLKLNGNGDINNCSIVKTSDAQGSDSQAIVLDTNVTGVDSYVSAETTTAFVGNTNAVVTEVCYHGPDISVSPTSLNFGSINVGSSSSPRTFTISNTGAADLHVSDITLSDTTNYSLNVNGGSSPCGSTTPTIAPNSNCTVAVVFSPLSTGQKDASLTVNSNDPDTPTVNVLLTGIGVKPDTIPPSSPTLQFAGFIEGGVELDWDA